MVETLKSSKLVIPMDVEGKIRILLEKIHNIEWSGILFYDYVGDLKNGITITCKDILPLNIGNSVYTEFEMSAEVISFMVENNLMDCQMGLIHSHHSMDTFFSGTDVNTLKTEGAERNNFVSLIVNNAGTYNAAITWKEHKVIERKIITTHPFFDAKVEEKCTNDTVEENTVEYAYLPIAKEYGDYTDLNNRIIALKKEHDTIIVKDPLTKCTKTKPVDFKDIDLTGSVSTKKEPTLFEDKLINTEPLVLEAEDAEDVDPELIAIDAKISDKFVDAAVAQLVSLSLTASKVPVNNTDSILSTVDRNVKNRFKNASERQFALENYCTIVIEGLIDEILDGTDDESIGLSIFAEKVINKLKRYENKVSHIKEIIDYLQNYCDYGNIE